MWLNGRDLRGLPLVERKKILRSVVPRKPKCIGFVSQVDRGALKLFELALHDYQTNVEADQVIKAVHQLTSEIHAHVVPRTPATPAPR